MKMLISKGLADFEKDLLFKEFDTIILTGRNSKTKEASTVIISPNKQALKESIDFLKQSKEKSPNVIIKDLI